MLKPSLVHAKVKYEKEKIYVEVRFQKFKLVKLSV